MLKSRKLAIASVVCTAGVLGLSPSAIAKPHKTHFKKIAEVTTFAASVFGPRAELTTPPFNPGPHGKIRVTVQGAVTENAQYGQRAGVDGTLTCSKGGQQLSASSGVVQTLLPFTTTYSTNVTGIKDPKTCTLYPFAYWDPETPPDNATLWPKGIIALTVFLKK
jgi:hypothetical protein